MTAQKLSRRAALGVFAAGLMPPWMWRRTHGDGGARAPVHAATMLTGIGVTVRLNEITPDLLSKAKNLGFHWLRTDVRWARVEHAVGSFDFSAEKSALSLVQAAGFEVLAILDYGHPVHTSNRAPANAEQSNQFAAFAKAAETALGAFVSAWEVWNEPNHPQFWPPAPNADDFVTLFDATATEIWALRPDRQLVTGGLSGFDVEYLRRIRPSIAGIAKRGPVAISIHPYRHSIPETLADDIRMAGLIDSAGNARTPEGVPIWVSEWGYCRLWEGMNPVRQGELDVRIPLVSAGLGIPVTILFELVDGGPQSQSANTCGLLEAHTLQNHPAAEEWRQAAGLLAKLEPAHPGLTEAKDHWSLDAGGGRLSWGDANLGASWCPLGGDVAKLRIGNTLLCYEAHQL